METKTLMDSYLNKHQPVRVLNPNFRTKQQCELPPYSSLLRQPASQKALQVSRFLEYRLNWRDSPNHRSDAVHDASEGLEYRGRPSLMHSRRL